MAENLDIRDLSDPKQILMAERDRLRKIKKRSLIIAPIVLVLVVIYFNFIYFNIRRMVEPDFLAAVIEAKIEEAVPRIAADLEQQLIKSSPGLARRLFRDLITSAPQVRKQTEEFILGTSDDLLIDMRGNLNKIILDGMREHKADIQKLMRDLKDEKAKKELTANLSAQIKASLRENPARDKLDSQYKIFSGLQYELELLAESKNLTEEQTLKRDIIRAIRTLLDRGILDKEPEL